MYNIYLEAGRILRTIEQPQPTLFTGTGRFWEDDPMRYYVEKSPELFHPHEDDELRHVFVEDNGLIRHLPPGSFPHGNKRSVIIYTAGVHTMRLEVCSSAFIHRSGIDADGEVSWKVERNGTDGLPHPVSQNRADLQAVVGDIGYYAWTIPVYSNIIIATFSRYVAYGACNSLYSFSHDNYPASQGVEQQEDLWAALVDGLSSHDQGDKDQVLVGPFRRKCANNGLRLATLVVGGGYGASRRPSRF